jgi:hypothetical protein
MSSTQPSEATNWEIFLWSLHELGGGASFVDIEDVFIRCFELAPNRFAWRTKDNLPDYKKCAKGLRDAEARRPALLVKTRDGLKRQLTVEGQEWITENSARLAALLRPGRIVQEPKQRPRARLLGEIEKSNEFDTWTLNRTVPAEKWRVAELLHCSPDSDPRVWNSRLEFLRSAAHAAGKTDVLAFLENVLECHSEWFNGGR